MAARIIKWKHVVEHCGQDKRMLRAFQRFKKIVSLVEWQKPQDIFNTFSSADLVTCKKGQKSRLVFNVGHNKYRFVAGFFFAPKSTILYVKFVGTHKEYDQIDVCLIDQFKSKK